METGHDPFKTLLGSHEGVHGDSEVVAGRQKIPLVLTTKSKPNSTDEKA
jgi:hypothetical protein